MVLWDRFYMTGCQGALPNHYSFTYNSDIHLKSYNSWLIVIIYYRKWPFIIHLYQRGGHPAFIHPLTIRIFAARFLFWSEWNVLDWIRASFGVAAPRFIIRTLHYCCGCHRPFALVVLLWVSTLSHLGGRISTVLKRYDNHTFHCFFFRISWRQLVVLCHARDNWVAKNQSITGQAQCCLCLCFQWYCIIAGVFLQWRMHTQY